jgi:hypothetical protein
MFYRIISGVNDYRDIVGVAADAKNGERLLEFMHANRSSPNILS